MSTQAGRRRAAPSGRPTLPEGGRGTPRPGASFPAGRRRAAPSGRPTLSEGGRGTPRPGASFVARHLALDPLHVELDAAEPLVVGDLVLLQQFLAVAAGDRALPDREAAVLQAGLGGLDLGLDLGRHL